MRINNVVIALRRVFVTGALIGMLCPPLAHGKDRAEIAVQDVTLQAGGELHGLLATPQGTGAGGTEVQLFFQQELVGSTTTDSSGNFAFHPVRPGVYTLRTGAEQRSLRVWSAQAAPPNAGSLAWMVCHGDVARGQGATIGSRWAQQLLLGSALVAAGVIGGVIGYNLRDCDPAS